MRSRLWLLKRRQRQRYDYCIASNQRGPQRQVTAPLHSTSQQPCLRPIPHLASKLGPVHSPMLCFALVTSNGSTCLRIHHVANNCLLSSKSRAASSESWISSSNDCSPSKEINMIKVELEYPLLIHLALDCLLLVSQHLLQLFRAHKRYSLFPSLL